MTRHSICQGFLRASFLVVLLCWAAARGWTQNLAGDMALWKVLIEGEGWQVVAEGYRFTDACCADAAGNFYFADVAQGKSIQRITPEGKIEVALDNVPRLSGLKFSPDGKLYGCSQGTPKQIVAFELPGGAMEVIASDVVPNDLVVDARGYVYFTETGKKQVTIIAPDRQLRVGDVGINKPNGITLSPDQGTLAVSDYGGSNVWTFRVGTDGGLSAKDAYMTLRTPIGKAESLGDGMTTDTEGRYYVTSAVGIQMFDATGRLGGVINAPQNKSTVSVAFAGPELRYLYAASSDKIFRRKIQAQGVLFFQKPRS